jgi:(R,R)-butanediol dehydrogenase / meso-butanediol dehydrogenase / diacetyl reductase
MRGIVFKGDRKLEILNIEDPTPGPGEAIIEIKASGICGSDLHFYRNKPSEVIKSLGWKDLESRGIDPNTEFVAGHEPSGVIAALGPGADSKFKVGDRVLIFHYAGCGHCEHCRTGWTQMCDEGAMVYGVVGHGGHADYMKLPVTSLVPMPDEISFTAGATLSCGTTTAWGALNRLNITEKDTLAIYGLGPVGLSGALLASAMGIEVIGVDIDPARLEQAKSFGVAHAIDGSKVDPVEEVHKLTGGKGVTCAVDYAGGEIPRAQAIRSTSRWGRIALVGVGGPLTVDAQKDLINTQRTVMGSYTFSQQALADCASFVASHGIDLDRIFSDRWSIDQAEEAYQVADKQTLGKGVFVF